LAAGGESGSRTRAFGACAACHSLEPDRNMTGPSLADLWNRKAGGLASFPRYSQALKSSNVVWDDKTLDAWIADPQHVVPGKPMTFQGIKDAQQRTDLLAFLKSTTQVGQAARPAPRLGGAPVPQSQEARSGGARRDDQLLRRHLSGHDGDGKTHVFWSEISDSRPTAAATVPAKGAPALVGRG